MTEVLVTMEALRAAGACYCEEGREDVLLALYPGRESVQLSEALRDERLPPDERVWLCAYLLPDDLRGRWAERVVTRAVTLYALPHPATAGWARRWLSGEDRTEGSARAAAEAARAAWAAWAAWAARAARAAWAARAARAARAAARTAARAAARAAEAAEAAAESADADERRAQIADALSVLEDTP